MNDLASNDQSIFAVLIEDHDRHRALLHRACSSRDHAQRGALFEELRREIKGHSAAEEQALWSTVLRIPAITEDGRHAVAEHHQIDKLLDELADTDAGSSEWAGRMEKLRDKYFHHIDEEENELFISIEGELSEHDKHYMAEVFERRKREEKHKA